MVLAAPSMSGVSGKKWRLRGRFPDGELSDVPGQAIVRHLLWHRGIRSAVDVEVFLEARDPGHDWRQLPDVERAVERLRRAIGEGEQIAVYGDFDVDGVTASAILVESLTQLGARAMSFIPDRFEDGYGVNDRAIEELAGKGIGLIVTADCGTGSVGEIELAGKLGVDVIVIDHHTVPPELPNAVAVINPKRADSVYGETELATGGLAFRVMQALYETMGRPYDVRRYLDLVALSTVCDMAPLRGENRWLVREGLRVLSDSTRPGVRALLEVAGCRDGRVDADTIGYTLGPRLNAAGRLAHAKLALDLVMETNEGRAREQALRLGELNGERQQATQRAVELAQELLAAEDLSSPLIFIGHEDMPPGIVGLVASRLLDQYNRPAIVYQREEQTSRASCRSIPEFHITDALRTHGGLMVKFGGHSAAAGFTVANGNLMALKEALIAEAERQLGGLDLTPVIEVDAALALKHVNGELVRAIGRMAPFGVDNPEPVFLSRGLEVRDLRVMGEDGKHLRLWLRDGRVTWPAVAFGFGEHGIQAGELLDVVYTFCADRGSDGGMELRVADLARATMF
jgi:single-stranded-DNA-specific exonuclease